MTESTSGVPASGESAVIGQPGICRSSRIQYGTRGSLAEPCSDNQGRVTVLLAAGRTSTWDEPPARFADAGGRSLL